MKMTHVKGKVYINSNIVEDKNILRVILFNQIGGLILTFCDPYCGELF